MQEKRVRQACCRSYYHCHQDEIEPNTRFHPIMQNVLLNTRTFSGHCRFLQLFAWGSKHLDCAAMLHWNSIRSVLYDNSDSCGKTFHGSFAINTALIRTDKM